jgi:hypothetical protein
LLDTASGPVPVEIKSGQTVNSNYFKGLDFFSGLNKNYRRGGLFIGKNIKETRTRYFIAGYSAVYELLDKLVAEENFKRNG